jgi:hypothetical protein
MTCFPKINRALRNHEFFPLEQASPKGGWPRPVLLLNVGFSVSLFLLVRAFRSNQASYCSDEEPPATERATRSQPSATASLIPDPRSEKSLTVATSATIDMTE